MNKKQRDNTAKYFYDISKGILLLVVVRNFIIEEINLTMLILGSLAAIGFYIWALIIDNNN